MVSVPEPVLGLESEPPIAKGRRRRSAAESALLLSTIGLMLMSLAASIGLTAIFFPALNAEGGVGSLCYTLAILLGLITLLISFALAVFTSRTPIGKKAMIRAFYAMGVFLIALLSLGITVQLPSPGGAK